MEPSEKILTVDDNGKVRSSVESPSSSPPLEYQGVLKKTPSTSVHGMRTIKSLSGKLFFVFISHSHRLFSFKDTISLQKKVVQGADRLKRLDSSTSLFQRQTSLLTRKVSTLATKLVNPFVAIKKKIEPTTPTTTVDNQVDLRTNMKRQISIVDATDAPRRTVTISPLKRARDEEDEEPKERRKVQMLSVNQEIRRPADLFSYEEEQEEEEEEEPKRSNKTLDFELKIIVC